VKWPGYQSYTDNDAGVFYFSARLYIYVSGFLLINSILFFILKHWRIYRTIAVFISVIISTLIVLPKEYFIQFVLGEEIATYKMNGDILNGSDYYIDLRLFKGSDFLSESSDYQIVVENVGQYKYNDDTLMLNFQNEKSDLIGARFLKIEDSLKCLDCSSLVKLHKQNQTKQLTSKYDFPDFNLKSILEHIFK
jgi:hypothetical protein